MEDGHRAIQQVDEFLHHNGSYNLFLRSTGFQNVSGLFAPLQGVGVVVLEPGVLPTVCRLDLSLRKAGCYRNLFAYGINDESATGWVVDS